VRSIIAIVVLSAPLSWLLIGGAIYRERRNGRLAPPLLRAVGYDMFAVTIGAIAATALVEPPEGAVSTPWPAAFGVGFGLGLLMFLVYSRSTVRAVARGIRLAPRRFVVQSTVAGVTSSAEEIAWRGVALTTALTIWNWPWWLAVGVTGVLFGALHVGLGGLRPVITHSITGAVLGTAYVLTGSLVVPIAAHVVYNLAVVGDHQLRPKDASSPNTVGVS
jgi:membrane protease YdiL (CAAX protease family)